VACRPGGEPPGDRGLVAVSVALTGGPRTSDGAVLATDVVLRVADETGRAVRFDSDGRQSRTGGTAELLIGADARQVTLHLQRGETFTFTARAQDEAARPLAYGTASHLVSPNEANAATVELVALLGAATLTPRLPTTAVTPGMELDLELAVTPPGRPDLVVPPAHFTARYALTNGELVAASEGGVRLRVGERAAGDLTVTARAEGLVPDGAAATAGAVTATATFRFPTELTLDAQRPTVAALAFDPASLTVSGEAHDDVALALVELYDGPVRLASTDPELVSERVAPIRFPGGGTAFLTHLPDHPGDTVVTLVATDHAGHESRSTLDLRAP